MEPAIRNVKNYLLEHYNQKAATAVEHAYGEIYTYDNVTTQLRKKFRATINQGLCEGLAIMNSDPYCPEELITEMRNILSGYRRINELPDDDFDWIP